MCQVTYLKNNREHSLIIYFFVDEEEYFDGEYFGGGDNDENFEPDTDRLNNLNLNGGGDAPAFEDAD